MGRIHMLDPITANGIAAGEVVERPSSVVKELMENAMDAGATVITVEIEGGGISMIRITDDGCGMDEEDAKQAFICHATSKIESLDDLFSLHTMGFRGEALSSISATSRVLLRTRQPGSDMGTEVAIEGGSIVKVTSTGCPSGTTIEVRDLFYNMPARYKFMKKDLTEAQYITTLCERFSMIRPDISFRLINQGKEILHTPGNNDPISSLYCIYGKQIVDQCIPIDEKYGELHIIGFAGKAEIAKSSRGEQTVFVNDRLIRSKTISSAIDEAYKTMLMKGRYAFIILSIRVPSHLVDVNVHPQKAEVRFWNDSEVFRAIYHVIHNALLSTSHVIEPHAHALFGSDGKDPANIIHTHDTEDSLRQIEVSLHRPPEYVYPIQSSILEASDGPKRFREEWLTEDESPAFVIPNNVPDMHQKQEFTLDSLLRARYIGIAFATYILLEEDRFLILLDQHAAHEKIIFETLVKNYKESGRKSMLTQPILVPVIMSMTPSDLLFLDEMSESIQKAGFRFEPIGEQEIILREIPNIPQLFHPADTFRSFVDTLKRSIPKTDEELLLHLATSACKAAVKGHDRLDELEVHALLTDLSKLEDPYHCPHGRPIIIRLFQKDLEKEFKRIV
jgi:DNA mismatch repair protein MutL